MKKLYKSFIAFALVAFAAGSFAQVSQPVGPGGRPQTFTNNGLLVGKGTSNVVATTPGTAGQCLLSNGSGAAPTFQACPTGGGSVSSFAFTNANGFNGSVSNPTTTPTLVLTTPVSGIIKGFSNQMIAATAGTDYSAGTSALGTGIVKTTTGTGALSVAVAGDFPTLNQNTTGTASNVTGTVAVANGGTGLTSAPANGALDIGNGTGFTRTTLTAGSGITITNGAGSISIASAGAAASWILVDTITTTASANAESLNFGSSSYDAYKIVYIGLKPSANDTLRARVAVGGSVDTASNYVWGTVNVFPGNTGAQWNINAGTGGADVAAAGTGASGYLELYNTRASGLMHNGFGVSTYETSLGAGNTYRNDTLSYIYTASTSTISGIRFYWTAGSNFVAGSKIYIYGMKNT